MENPGVSQEIVTGILRAGIIMIMIVWNYYNFIFTDQGLLFQSKFITALIGTSWSKSLSSTKLKK